MKNRILNGFMALVMSCVVLFTGCSGAKQDLGAIGNSNENAVNMVAENAEEDKGPFYLLTQRVIPDPDESMIPKEWPYWEEMYVVANRSHVMGDYAYSFWDRKIIGNTVCIMYHIYGEAYNPESNDNAQNSGASIDSDEFRRLEGFLIRVINGESGEEKNFCISRQMFYNPDEDLYPDINGIIGIYSDKLYVTMDTYNFSEEDQASHQSGICLGRCDAEGNGEVLGEIPYDYIGWEFFFDNNRLCAMDYNGSNLVTFDENFENPVQYKMSPRAQGYFTAEDGNTYYYGVSSSELWIKDEPNSDPIYTLGGSYKFNDYTDYAITINGDVIFAADLQGVYRYENGEMSYCSFTDQDFFFDTLNSAFPRSDGGFSMFGVCDGEYSVFDATPCETNPLYLKPCVYLQGNFGMEDLEKAVSRYNRRSDKCRIIIKEPDISDGYENMVTNLSMEMATGNGPDIFASGYYDCVSLASKGALVPLDDLIENDGDEYILPAFESCKIGGTLYSIPYSLTVSTLVTSEEFAEGKASLTLREFMENLEASGAEKAINLSKEEIVYWFGVKTPEDAGFIDWEKRKSNYDSEDFIELLEFAYKYGVSEGEQYSDMVYKEISDGKIPCMMERDFKLCDWKDCYNYFKGSPIYIGLPSKMGSSVMIDGGRSLCVNASSQYTEEAKDFLKWLISKDGQQAFYDAQYMRRYGDYFEMPLRWDILDEQIEAHNYYNSGGILSFEKADGSFECFEVVDSWGGASKNSGQLKEADIEMLRTLLRNAEHGRFEFENISNIVEEELGGFLAGQKTAEETAKVIDSRVQLYLDENK